MKKTHLTNDTLNGNDATKQGLLYGIPTAIISTLVFWSLFIIASFKGLIEGLNQPPSDVMFGITVIFLVVAPILTFLVVLVPSTLLGGLIGNQYWRLSNNSSANSQMAKIQMIGGISGGIVGGICGQIGTWITDYGSMLVIFGVMAGLIAGIWHARKMTRWLQ